MVHRDPFEWLEQLDVHTIGQHVEMRASPGWPYKRQYGTNKELFGWDGFAAQEDRLGMVKTAAINRLRQLLEKPLADPIYLFVKPEPHKIKKKKLGAWRLISGVGLIDTLIDRALYGHLLDCLTAKYREVPSKGGWAPQRGGYVLIQRSFVNPMAIDKSAWDWTVQEWMVEVLREVLPRLIYGVTDEWRTLLTNRFLALYSLAVFKPQCGCEFSQLVTGIQKSGCLGTLAFNSIWQYACHVLALRRGKLTDPGNFFCLGDDTIQESFDSPMATEVYMRELARTGCTVKEADFGWPTTFAGHKIAREDVDCACEPAYTSKHLYGLRYMSEEVRAETLVSYQQLYALKPVMRELVQRLLADADVTLVLSPKRLEWWYRYGE